ncbi:hypothetical protein [Chromohalobacter sp. 296-RDG]|uniref:hypothetical protein n=1 Tax=Chromohalobacter sp. 296-RDG TaxID=2994062 RepID=UPI002468D9D1|nr:hypothetical protein [Chromohalobacter sp. 296-RDG]
MTCFDYRCLIKDLVARTAAIRHNEKQARELKQRPDTFYITDALSCARQLDNQLSYSIIEITGNARLSA